jgi:hypothetical protein
MHQTLVELVFVGNVFARKCCMFGFGTESLDQDFGKFVDFMSAKSNGLLLLFIVRHQFCEIATPFPVYQEIW